MFVRTVAEPEAEGETAALYAQAVARYGAIPNFTRAFAHVPGLIPQFEAMTAYLKGRMGVRRYELVTLAAALELRSSYCALAHGEALLAAGVPAEDLAAVALRPEEAALLPVERAMMSFARQVVRDAAAIPEQAVADLKAHGLSDAGISEVVATAALRCFFAKHLDALGARPDPRYAGLPGALPAALARGRPIETEG